MNGPQFGKIANADNSASGLNTFSISGQNQEAFTRMINEGETGEEAEAGEGDLDQPGVIQVSPQDKEAIERVRYR